MIGKNRYKFLKNYNWSSSYKSALKFKYFITHSSTLGSELIARGKRVAFFHEFEKRLNYTKKYLKNVQNTEGYYQSFYTKKFNGKFWSSTSDKKKFKKVLNYTYFCSKEEFFEDKQNYIKPLVIYNKNDKRFKDLIKKIY